MDLGNALDTAERLRQAITAEVERARGERHLLRTLDSEGLFTRATQRAAFVAEATRLERELAVELGRAFGVLGTGPAALARLRAAAPGAGDRLADTVSEVRALAGALEELDGLNLQLARRALTCVRGYVDALRPAASAYDRRGAPSVRAATALVTSKG